MKVILYSLLFSIFLINIMGCSKHDWNSATAKVVTVSYDSCNSRSSRKGRNIFSPKYSIKLVYSYETNGNKYEGSQKLTPCLGRKEADKANKSIKEAFPYNSEINISYLHSMPSFSQFSNEWVELEGTYTSLSRSAKTRYDGYDKTIKLGKVGYKYIYNKETFLKETENHKFQVPLTELGLGDIINIHSQQINSKVSELHEKFRSETEEDKKVLVYLNAENPEISYLIKPFGGTIIKMTKEQANSNPCPWPSFKRVPYIAKRGVLQKQIKRPDYYSVPKHYLTTKGHVTEYLPCNLNNSEQFADCCKVYVEYSYNVNGKTHESHLIGVGNYSSPENFEKFKQMYPKDDLTVYYDPNDPSIASI